MNTQWNPRQYEKFEKERSEPFYDLMTLIEKKAGMDIVDLGCGTGALTAILHETLQAKNTLGIDSSMEMLSQAKPQKGLSFVLENVENFNPKKPLDLIFSNACLQWLPDHEKLFKRMTELLAPHGQIAVQVPANGDYFTHILAEKLAQESPFKEKIKEQRIHSVLTPEIYSQLLYRLGYRKQVVRLQVYGHVLSSSEGLVEWVKGTFLTFYEKQLSPELYQEYLREYRSRIWECAGEGSPFFLPFKRLLIWGIL